MKTITIKSNNNIIAFGIFVLIFLISCSDQTVNNNEQSQLKNNNLKQQEIQKVTGIGGIFFKCQDSEKMKTWFHKNLGLIVNEYGSIYEFRHTDNPDEFGYLQWSPFSNKTTYFQPS